MRQEDSWQTRFRTMGDIAEAKFEEYSPFGKWQRYGWNRPSVSMNKMSRMLKQTPDYYSGGYLIEVMGCGGDGIVKLKVDKFHAMESWNDLVQLLRLWVYNSVTGESKWVDMTGLRRLVYLHPGLDWDTIPTKQFSSDHKEYYPLEFNTLGEET